jgi:hypothetical protein
MTALDVLELARKRGINVKSEGGNLRVRGPRPAVLQLADKLKAHKPEIIDELRRREPAAAAALLRRGEWPPTLPVCDFLIGKPAEACRRCGASWIEHYPSADVE